MRLPKNTTAPYPPLRILISQLPRRRACTLMDGAARRSLTVTCRRISRQTGLEDTGISWGEAIKTRIEHPRYRERLRARQEYSAGRDACTPLEAFHSLACHQPMECPPCDTQEFTQDRRSPHVHSAPDWRCGEVGLLDSRQAQHYQGGVHRHDEQGAQRSRHDRLVAASCQNPVPMNSRGLKRAVHTDISAADRLLLARRILGHPFRLQKSPPEAVARFCHRAARYAS